MNHIDNLLLRDCDHSAFKFGFPVLHANIRFLEYFLNLAERRHVRKGYCEYTPEEKKLRAATRKTVTDRLAAELGLLIDQPSRIPGSGNTNTGNNARRFFDNPVQVINAYITV